MSVVRVKLDCLNLRKIQIAVLSLAMAVAVSQDVSAQEDYKRLYTWEGGGVVASAGDVNADGYKDVIVGQAGPNAGMASYVKIYSGKDGSVIQSIRDESISFGFSVSGVGDVDKDGFDDVIVGDPTFGGNNGHAGHGAVKVFSGKSGGIIYSLDGPVEGGSFGWSVADAGDVNADGYDDFIVGSPSERDMAGSARVYSGKDGTVLHLLAPRIPDSGNKYRLIDRFGESVAGLGDVNKDGYDDFVVGAPYDSDEDKGRYDTLGGSARVFSGKDGSVIHTVWGSASPEGEYRFDLGHSVAAAGDVNRDGYPDFIVGAPDMDVGAPWETEASSGPGQAFVFSGKDGTLLHSLYGERPAEPGFEQMHPLFGTSVSGAGDMNADGYDDVIVGAYMYKGVGRAQVFSGKDGAILYSFEGDEWGGSFGWSISGGSDLNGDGLPDVIVAPPVDWPNSGRPTARVVVFSDSCPGDSEKALPGQCGCGVPDTDSDGDSIADCNEKDPPTDISLSASSLPENAGADAVVGTLTTTDPNAGDTFTYTLVSGAGSTDNASFNISTDKLRATNSFDFETKSTYSVRIRSTDRDGLFTEKAFTINVTDVDDGITVTGTAANDSFVATYQGDGATHRWLVTRGGTTVFNGVVASAVGLIIDGLAGTDTLQVVGRTTDDRLALGTAKFLVNGAAVTFPGIETLRLAANSGNDALTLVEALPAGVSTSFDGGAGTDRLEVVSGANTWSVTGSGIGNLNSGLPFTAVESLVGGSEVDQFVFAAAGSVAGRVIGGAGVDTLNLSAKTTTHTVNLQTNTATSTGGIESIETILGSSAATDVLVAPNTVNSWQIDGANAGTLNSQVAFSGFENLTGGTAADTFTVGANGGVARVINGGNGVDLLDLRAKAGAIEVRLGTTPSIPGVAGGYSLIERVIGNGSEGSKIVGTSANTAWTANAVGDITVGAVAYRGLSGIEAGFGSDTLTFSSPSPNDGSYWRFRGLNSGTLIINQGGQQTTISFSSIENAEGGSFEFLEEGAISGAIKGSGQSAGIMLSERRAPVEIQLGSPQRIIGIVGSFSNIRFIDTNRGIAGHKVKGPNTDSTWFVYESYLTVASMTFENITQIEAGTGIDTFVSAGRRSPVWTVSGVNSGVCSQSGISPVAFSGVENLTGSDQYPDRFVFGAAGEITGRINGGIPLIEFGINTIDFTAKTGSFDMTLGSPSTIPGVVGSFTSVQKVLGNLRSVENIR